MGKRILITGGAGFLGSYVCELLLQSGYEIRVLDVLSETISNGLAQLGMSSGSIEYIHGDLRNRELVERALENVDAVIHLASVDGATVSMYRFHDFADTNCTGTAVLLEVIMRKGIERLIVGSSMAVYGEGMYMDREGKPVNNAARSLENLKKDIWEPLDAAGEDLIPVSTPESKPVDPVSVYGLSIYAREKMCLLAGATYNFPVTGLRFFNIYGKGQHLFNGFGGLLSSVAYSLLKETRPVIFEDGYQLRDFIDVRDAAAACKLALETPTEGNQVYNIGTGKGYSIKEAALKLAMILGRNKIYPETTRKYRAGDVRHCYADSSLASQKICFTASTDLDSGLYDLGEWLKGQSFQEQTNVPVTEWNLRGLTI